MGRFCPIGSGGSPLEQTFARLHRFIVLGSDSLKAPDVGAFREEIQQNNTSLHCGGFCI